MNVTEDRLTAWARPLSETEDGKCNNTIQAVTGILREKFGTDIIIAKQGSHYNRTNIRQDSDVDILVVHKQTFFYNTNFLQPELKFLQERSFAPAVYTFQTFKNEVHRALEDVYGSRVERRNKCINIVEGSTTVNADVVPAFLHHRYGGLHTVSDTGIQFVSDDGDQMISFPDQHYNNGVQKNASTGKNYKSVVRILKNIRNELIESRRISSELMPSYMLECLVWNVFPHTHFTSSSYKEIVRNVLLQLWSDLNTEAVWLEYAEVSDLKYLYKGHPRNPTDALIFIQAVWEFIGYEN